jgi:hypothetical protein
VTPGDRSLPAEIVEPGHGDGAHARMNSLVRTLVNFERAFECAR